MMFRKLYWVTEEVASDGGTGIHGVYTSIPDLIRNGIDARNGKASNLRLSLVKLDCADGPLGIWQAPKFEGLSEDIQKYVHTDEFSADQAKLLVERLAKL